MSNLGECSTCLRRMYSAVGWNVLCMSGRVDVLIKDLRFLSELINASLMLKNSYNSIRKMLKQKYG